MPRTTPEPYPAEQRERALELYLAHGPAEASRRCGIKAGTIRSWAKRAGMQSPRAAVTRAATKAAQETWMQRRGALRDASGEAAAEFLAEARRRMKENARAATDHMRSFSIAITTASTLQGQTAGDSNVYKDEELDAQVEELVNHIREEEREQVLAEVREEAGGLAETPAADADASEPLSPQNGQRGGTPPSSPRARQRPR